MSADKPKGPGKPFLGQEELSSELDAWDSMFDNLHGGPDPSENAGGNAEVMAWPAPAPTPPPPPVRVPEPALTQPELSHTEETLHTDLEEQMTLDRAVHEDHEVTRHKRPTSKPATVPAATLDADPLETDFSDIGADGPPAALGGILSGGKPEDDYTSVSNPPARAGTAPPDEDDVYTSASRPNVGAGAHTPSEDPLAPPPLPAVQPRRTGPAIIRRQTPLAVPAGKYAPPGSPVPDEAASPFAENTRVADLDEIEQHAHKARMARADARSKAPTAPPPFAFSPMDSVEMPTQDEDDYADIEIGADAAEAAEAAPAEAAPRKLVAHVVRRPDKVTKQPVEVKHEAEAVIEVAADEPPQPAQEDDFSDVAAAVGAEDGVPAIDEVPRRRPTTPAHEIHAVAIDPTLDAENDLAIDHEVDAAIDVEEVGGETRLDVPRARSKPRLESAPIPPPPPKPERPEIDLDALHEEASHRPPAIVDVYARGKPSTGSIAHDAEFETLDGVAAPRQKPLRLQTPLPAGDDVAETEPTIDLEAIQLPEQLQPLPTSQLDEQYARTLEIYEREIATVDESSTSAALRLEAGRLCEQLGELERARSHYDAALLADPRATAALRGLRRLARASGDLGEATRQLDAEFAVAGALERRPLGHYRIDLLMASGEQDLARVAAGEVLDSAPSDVRALLANLELAFLDGRADEFGAALERLSHAVTDPELRAAVQSARGMLAGQQHDNAGAATWFAAAAESDPASLAARLGAIRQFAGSRDGEATAKALLELARQIEATDPLTAAALAVRAQFWHPADADAAQLAVTAMPGDPLVARVAADSAMAGGDPAAAAAAMSTWAATEATPVERAYASARAAELDPARGAELWAAALAQDPGDDYAAAQLRTAFVANEALQLAIEVDLEVAADGTRERARLRAAFGLIGQGRLDDAIALLAQGHETHPGSLALTEALAEALAAAGRWADRAKLLGELANDPGEQLDKDVAQLRSALAWEEAVGAAASTDPLDPDEVQRTTAAALQAWDRVLETTRNAPAAHAAAIVLASRLGDREVIGEVLARAQEAETSPWAAASLALRRARLVATDASESAAAETILRDAAANLDDPRRTVWLVLAAARRNELADAVAALEARATQLDGETEASALRLRAAQLALDIGDASRAATLLGRVSRDLPALNVIHDLVAAARRRSGDRPSATPPRGTATNETIHPDSFARIVRDADLAAAQNDGATALALYQRALDLRPGDPLATLPLIRVATQTREPAPLAALALGQLRAAETAGDNAAKAEAYELLAHIDKELRADPGSAQIALESASQSDPTRIDLMHRLEREYTSTDQIGELLRLRRAELEQIPDGKDKAAMIMDTAGLAERDHRPDDELVELYRGALAADPHYRLALLHLESIVRRQGASPELATLEDQIAAYFDGDPRTQATFYTRAGETLAEIGQIDAAVQKFGKAEEVQPGHVAALEGWRAAAMKGQLWIDVAQAAQRQAAAAADPDTRGALYHFAGVVLMDKALVGDQAMAAFRHTLETNPGHKDAFLRLRILLEEDGNHDELAIVLSNRLDYETDERARIEIHRAVAELHRNFLDDRETAKKHYREILTADPNDLRAHAAVADIAWEQGNWQEAADALISRARLERDAQVLTTLCYRLGLLYADRLNDPGMALKALQRALTYQPDDENTLTRLADIATQTGEWKMALGACERLVKSTEDPEKRAGHLHRVAKIFKLGFGDNKRAERALNLALDGAPTNDEALTRLVEFYREAGDMVSVRVHLNRVAGTMRARVAADPKDGVAYRVIARAMAARGAAGVEGSYPIARAAAELATLLGAAGEPERLLLAETRRVDLAALLRPDTDEVLYPRGIQTELRQLFTLLGDRIAKHVGVDLRAYGVGRGDRMRAGSGGGQVATHAQDIATGLGFGEIDVYVSARQPYAMVAEPTSPVSLVIGQSIANGDVRGIRFAAGAALKLAQASLAIPARLSESDLGVLVVALLRLFQPEFPQEHLEESAIATQMQKLRRLIPTNLMNELRPFALAIDAPHFKHEQLARDLRVSGLRAGLVASGSLLAGLTILAAHQGTDVPSFLADPVAQGLVSFALSEDHAAVTR